MLSRTTESSSSKRAFSPRSRLRASSLTFVSLLLNSNPTPKKRPVKLTKTQSPARLPQRNDIDSPSYKRSTNKKPADGRRPMSGGSSLRVEVDLTCDTSDEDDADAGDSDYRDQSDEVCRSRCYSSAMR